MGQCDAVRRIDPGRVGLWVRGTATHGPPHSVDAAAQAAPVPSLTSDVQRPARHPLPLSGSAPPLTVRSFSAPPPHSSLQPFTPAHTGLSVICGDWSAVHLLLSSVRLTSLTLLWTD